MKKPLKVFLSYAKEDIEAARRLRNFIPTRVADVWFDEEALRPGARWKREITKSIRSSDLFVVLLSRASVTKRGVVQREVREALDVMQEVPEDAPFVIPVRLEAVEPEHLALKDIQWVDLFPHWHHGARRLKSLFYERLDAKYPPSQRWLADVVRAAIARVIAQTPSNVSITFNDEYGIPLKVLVTDEFESLVLGNMLVNAVQYSSPTQQKIVVKVAAYRFGSAAVVDVTNTGPVIPSDMITHGVLSFFPSDEDDRDGYGLPIANEVMEAHGGRLHIVSTRSDANDRFGTTVVSIMLPLAYDYMGT